MLAGRLPELGAQFERAGWSTATTNHWSNVYDFSPATAGEGQAAGNWRALSLAEHGAARWCELQGSPSGLNGGTVVEAEGATPSVRGCECPCAAADGTQYAAEWYDVCVCVLWCFFFAR